MYSLLGGGRSREALSQPPVRATARRGAAVGPDRGSCERLSGRRGASRGSTRHADVPSIRGRGGRIYREKAWSIWHGMESVEGETTHVASA